MERQSCLTDRAVPVVADTSVLINLNATKCAEAILDALPNPFLAVSELISVRGGAGPCRDQSTSESDRDQGRAAKRASTPTWWCCLSA